jgi:hypothetical protein
LLPLTSALNPPLKSRLPSSLSIARTRLRRRSFGRLSICLLDSFRFLQPACRSLRSCDSQIPRHNRARSLARRWGKNPYFSCLLLLLLLCILFCFFARLDVLVLLARVWCSVDPVSPVKWKLKPRELVKPRSLCVRCLVVFV